MQGDIRGMQRAVACSADLCDVGGAGAACRNLVRDADERAGPHPSPRQPPPDAATAPIAGDTATGLNVLHVAAARGQPALVEFIWQVCPLATFACPSGCALIMVQAGACVCHPRRASMWCLQTFCAALVRSGRNAATSMDVYRARHG